MSHDRRAFHRNGRGPVMNQVIAEISVTTVADELRQPRSRRPATLMNAYLEGTYSEIYPDKSEDAQGMCKFIKQFSFLSGIGSHCIPEMTGSIHEDGELGYSAILLTRNFDSSQRSLP
jgi:xylulose-5-phosphate/fructose-6-phosphate phosphoketolase